MKKHHQRKNICFVFFLLCVSGIFGLGLSNAGIATTQGDYSAEIVWCEYDGKNYQIYQSSLRNGSWTAKTQLSNNDATNTVPVIDSGDDGTIWVVWSAARGTTSDLFFCSFNGGGWTAPTKIPSQFSSNTSPSIIVDSDNVPWIVWAGFDGQDDDIFLSRWNGGSWETPARVNRNDGTPDIMPAIWKNHNGSICVKWSGYNGKVYNDYLATWSGMKWEGEVEDKENEYQSFLRNIKDIVPGLPEFVKNPELAAVYFNWNGNRAAFRIRDLNEMMQQKKASPGSSMQNNLTSGEDIVIGFGDSITQGIPYVGGYGDGRRVGGYEPHLEGLTQGVGWQTQVLNYGVGGESTREGLYRIETVLSMHAAKYVLILEGTNDLLYYGISPSSTMHNLSRMVDQSRQHGVIPMLSTLSPDTKSPEKHISTAYNPEIQNLALQQKVALADQYAALASNWFGLTYDGLHPNDAGYQVMAATWFDAIPRITVATKEATDVGEDAAQLNGVLNPYGYPTTYYFEYGYTTDFGGKTSTKSAGSGNGEIAVSTGIEGISENHVYFFRLVASNDYTTEKGNILQFKTAEAPSKTCFIATAAFGSSLEPHVMTLKLFRDRHLSTTSLGKKFVQFYYKHSPPVAKYISEHETTKAMVMAALYPVVWFCEFFSFVSIKATLLVGIPLAILSAFGLVLLRRKRR